MKAALSWSGGKDSALALYEIKLRKDVQIELLLTTVSEEYNRVSMHGIRRNLLIKQAKSINLPLNIIELPKDCTNEQYNLIMKGKMLNLRKRGISTIIFGDIFLEEIRSYREQNLSDVQMKAIFPLWNKDTKHLAHNFIELGYKAIITSVDSQYLDKSFLGRIFDFDFLNSLPTNVDPCGENGEFHSFVFNGPSFNKNIAFKTGEIKFEKERFYYLDLILDPQ
jgi:uncharacterized protein (TIGR00290 family)